MLIRKVELGGHVVDVRLHNGLIAEISDKLPPKEGEHWLDGHGGALLPGLHDHHIHLNASAAALSSVKCGPPEVCSKDELRAALHGHSGSGWLRGIGYHASAIGEIDRKWLDEFGPDRPIRIQHRGGRMWIFNSRAMALLDVAIPDDGRLVDGDADIRTAWSGQKPDLELLVRLLLSHGITGVTEVTPGNDRADLEHYQNAAKPLRLSVMGGPELHGAKAGSGVHLGALKIHNHDHDLPALSDLVTVIKDAHNHDRPVAVHCVTRAELMLTLAALEEAGSHSGDRIEHAAIADEAAIAWMVRLGLTIVTQPHFITERAEAYQAEVEPVDRPHLWRLKSFADAGLRLAAGSDAPFGDNNPWAAMASAVQRPVGLTPAEAVSPEMALAFYTKPADNAGADARRIRTGEPADLCLLDRPWEKARLQLAEVKVQATWIAGELVYETSSSTSPQSTAV